jgi:diacylglycerol O-acyltransferase / trehalose O-mycolyltransferase / mycolyltransferase Ag85
MTTLDRRGFLGMAAATGVAAAVLPRAAFADGQGDRPPHLIGIHADDGAVVVAANVLDPRTVDITINSPALGHTAGVRILLPEGFDARSGGTWPVLYLLHGGFGSYVDWTDQSSVKDLTRKRDVLVVMPDGGSLGFYTDWWDHGAGNKPAWETFHLVELPQIVDRGFHASQRRAIAGLSMGGFGVMSYAARHQGFFQAAASFSGTLNTLQPTAGPLSSGPFAPWLLQTFYAPIGYDGVALFGDPTAQRSVWAAHNPADLVGNLHGTKLYVSCGDGHVGPLDPPGTDPSSLGVVFEASQLLQNEEFIKRATSLGLDLTSDLYTGSHSWPYWARQFTKAFPLLMHAIGA